MQRQLVTIAEAQLLLGISRATIAAAIRDGSLKSIKLSGRRRRIRVDHLGEWLGTPIVLPVQS
jgi:excisionase family DNA binding protein